MRSRIRKEKIVFGRKMELTRQTVIVQTDTLKKLTPRVSLL